MTHKYIARKYKDLKRIITKDMALTSAVSAKFTL